MSTITIDVPIEPIVKKVDITLPCYRKWESIYYRIISKSEVVQVNNFDHTTSGVSVECFIPRHAVGLDSQDSNAEEFTAAYEAVQLKITNAVNTK